jgi:competence protein ComEC
MVEALVLGRRDNIDPALRARFADSGLVHILAISGLHVGVLAAWILLAVRPLVGSRLAWVVSAGLVWSYVGLLGFPAPATRAAAFISILGLARARQRHPPASAVLAVAVLLVMALDPGAVTSVGAWLSVAAVWGTRVGAAALPKARLLGASLGATLMTAPITALVFGAVAPIGIVANLVAVPLAGIAVPGLFLSLVFGEILAGGTGLVLAAIEWVAARGSAMPGGHLTGPPGVRFAIPWFVLLVCVLWVGARRPSWPRLRRWGLLGAATASWVAAALPLAGGGSRSGQLSIHFLSVGQGDAILLETPGGSWVMVDGGPRAAGFDAGKRVVLPFMRRRGVDALAVVVVSHGDADHLGGVPAVVSDMSPGLVLDPGQPHGSALYLEYLESLDRVGADWTAARAGDVFEVDSVRFEVLHPRTEWLETHLEPNDNSVVLRASYGCFSAILTGDIEWPAESLLVTTVEESDLLKVGHHGAPGGTTDAWLDVVNPRAAVISVGSNSYGHPASSTLRRLSEHGVAVFRTDRGGTVTARSDGRYFQITQGVPTTPLEAIKCLTRRLLRSRGSSSSRRSCTPTPPVSSPSCSTT